MSALHEHHLRVERTARYFTMGAPERAPEGGIDELWYVCHGYRQSAERFLGHFRSIGDEHRIIVAPEALSRFYIEPAEGRHGPADRVGASWMTREDRESEIRDYVGYLDALDARITAELGWKPGPGAPGRSPPGRSASGSNAPGPNDAPGRRTDPALRRVVLGFSQGVHTAARWVARGKIRPAHLVLWGAYLPSDLEMKRAAPRLRALTLTLVRGLRDGHAEAELQAREEERLEEWEIPFRTLTFDGGHRIDDGVLEKLTAAIGPKI
jgi:hypothetical protein